MNLTAMSIAALILLPTVGLITWAWFAMPQVDEDPREPEARIRRREAGQGAVRAKPVSMARQALAGPATPQRPDRR